MKAHQNLFEYYENKSGVYGKLQSDYLRDNKQIRWCALITNILVVAGLVVNNNTWQLVLLIASAFTAIQLIVYFIDQSNRNFLMHAIDWLEADKNTGKSD